MVCKYDLQNNGPASWLTMGGGQDITTRGEPEEQVHRLYVIVLSNGEAAFTLTVVIPKIVAGLSLILLCFSFAVAASRPNLVLITLDSARAARRGFLGASRIESNQHQVG